MFKSHHDVIKSKIFKLQRWRHYFWKAHEKLSWVAKVKLYLASAVFELLLIILGEDPNYSSNSEDCLLIIILFLRNFSRPISPTILPLSQWKLKVMIVSLQHGLLWLFVTLHMIESELFSKIRDLTKKHKTPAIFTLFQIFFLFCSRVQGKAHGRHPSRPIYHRLQTRGDRKWRFCENVKYLLYQWLLDIYENWRLLHTQCQKVVVKLWLRKHCISNR